MSMSWIGIWYDTINRDGPAWAKSYSASLNARTEGATAPSTPDKKYRNALTSL